MIVFSEYSDRLPPSASVDDLRAGTEAARLAGCRIFHIPSDFSVCETAENALWHVPRQASPQLGFWIGYIPDVERYRAIYGAAAEKNIRLINTPDEHARAMEFDGAYERLRELTPKSVIVESLDDCERAAETVGLPVFVKGVVQSRKSRGWKACVADDLEELKRLASYLFELEARTRGRVIVRELVRLRHTRTSGEDFPMGREYRVFVYRSEILGLGYYWEGEDELSHLSPDEEAEVRTLAVEAARRLEVPFLSVDIGQRDDGTWIVIEVGDGQFAGLSQVPRLELWNRIGGLRLD